MEPDQDRVRKEPLSKAEQKEHVSRGLHHSGIALALIGVFSVIFYIMGTLKKAPHTSDLYIAALFLLVGFSFIAVARVLRKPPA